MSFSDDVTFGPINLNETFYMKNFSINAFYICSNGFVSNIDINTYSFPDNFNQTSDVFIGTLLIDLRNYGTSFIYYRQTRNQSILNETKKTIMGTLNSQFSSFNTDWAFIVTWKDISIYGTALNTFTNTIQLVLTRDNNKRSFVIFNYEKLSIPNDKLYKVKAGFTLGDSINYLSITDFVKDLFNNTNKLPISVVYPLNSSENCTSTITSTYTETTTSTITSTSTENTTSKSSSTTKETTLQIESLNFFEKIFFFCFI